jgi:hypothetical protein
MMEESYRGLLDEPLAKHVNELARRIEEIREQFDHVSGQFKIISYYQQALPNPTEKMASLSSTRRARVHRLSDP